MRINKCVVTTFLYMVFYMSTDFPNGTKSFRVIFQESEKTVSFILCVD